MWVGLGAAMLGGAVAQGQGTVVDLPSSKQLGVVPGSPQRVNSEPISMAVSPDGRYVVTVNVGYGTFESKYEQSLAVMDTQTGKVMDYPDDRTATTGKQTLYSGLAFSGDGKHLYASMASLTDPTGSDKGDVGNGIAVYGFDAGKITPERLIPIGLQKLEGARRTKLIGGADGAMGVPYPAAIAVIPPTHGDMTAMNGAPGLVAGERAGGGQSFRRCVDDRCNDWEGVDAIRPIGERCGAKHVSGGGGGIQGWDARICSAVECERGGGTRSEEGDGGAEAGAAEAERSGEAGDAPLRVGFQSGREDPLCGAGEPGCRCIGRH